MPHEPNRALARQKLEALAWQNTPADYRGSSGIRREVLLNTTEGTTLVPLGDMTDNQLRRYIGPRALEEAGDMRKNGRGIYSGTVAQQNDYVIHKHSGGAKYYADRVERGGTHTRIGGARGAATVREIMEVIRKDAHTRGISGEVFEQRGDELVQTGHTGVRGSSTAEYDHRDTAQGARDEASAGGRVFRTRGTANHTDPDSRYHPSRHRQNARRPSSSHGLHENLALLQQFVEMTAESMEIENYRDAEVTPEVIEMAHRYDLSLHLSLERLVRKYPPKNGASVKDLWLANAPYLVLMTLRGEGVGIWDGDWDDFYPDTTKVEEELKRDLHSYSSGSGSGSLEDAFMNAACETTGGCADYSKNAGRRREEPDETAARELSLYIENEYSLVGAPNSQGKAIEKNLLAKMKKGTFDLALSEKAWMYLIESGAKKYSKEFGDGESAWSRMFNKPTRELVAHEFATTFYAEHQAR